MAPALLLQQYIFQGDAQLIAVSMQTMQHAVEQTFLTKGDGNGLVRHVAAQMDRVRLGIADCGGHPSARVVGFCEQNQAGIGECQCIHNLRKRCEKRLWPGSSFLQGVGDIDEHGKLPHGKFELEVDGL